MGRVAEHAAVVERSFADEQAAARRRRNLDRGRLTAAANRRARREREQRDRVRALERERVDLEQRIPRLEAAYAAALRHSRLRGLEEVGDELLGSVLRLERVERDLRRTRA